MYNKAFAAERKKRAPAEKQRWPEKMKIDSIRDKLVEQGKALFNSPKQVIQFTKNKQANALLNDLDRFPHAFVLACVMDRQIKAERAWMIPYMIAEKIGGFSIKNLGSQSKEDIRQLMSKPEPLHRFVDKMADYFYSAVIRIKNQYNGNASAIWSGKPSSAEVVYRFLEFSGVGPKIGSMAANILAREFKILFADYYSIDISADVHIRRVFGRLGICAPDATVEQVVYKARALYPEFPGMMDLPCWEIGRKWCKPRVPECNGCYMNGLCPTAQKYMNGQPIRIESTH